MLTIGCHLSSSKGFVAMAKDAIIINANTFSFFTRNPRGGSIKPVNLKDIEEFLKIAQENNFQKLVAHAPYTLNACSADEGLREFALNAMKEDISRMELIPNNYYNFHPGSHVKQGVDVGINYISELLNNVIKPEQTTIILLETMAGKGSEVGRNFEELKEIIDKIKIPEKIGVCLDTCHIWDGGYNIVDNLDEVINEFDRIIGLNKLKAIHLNDSMNPIDSHKDRHSKIGEGTIGFEAIVKIINHPALRNLPFILETPNELEGYAKEIQMLRNAYNQ